MLNLNLIKPHERYDIQNTSNLLNDFVFKNKIKTKLISLTLEMAYNC